MTDTQIKATLTRNGIKTLELDKECIVVTIDLDFGWVEKMEWFERFIEREGFRKEFAHVIANNRVCIACRR